MFDWVNPAGIEKSALGFPPAVQATEDASGVNCTGPTTATCAPRRGATCGAVAESSEQAASDITANADNGRAVRIIIVVESPWSKAVVGRRSGGT
jgi:hypothetical protein